MGKVLFINDSIYLPGEKAIKRTFFLFEMMRKQGYDVTFLTSDFNHYEKKTRNTEDFYEKYPEYKERVRFIHKRPYKRNISYRRFISCTDSEKKELEWFVENGKEFDAVYISWPTYYLVYHIRKYCDQYNTKLIIDVNDLWPDSLRMVIRNDIIYGLLTKRLQRKTNISFSYADAIVAVSDEYLKKAADENTRAKEHLSVYIGAMLDRFDSGAERLSHTIQKPAGERWITYIGTLGRSYDFDTVICAVKRLKAYDVRFKILGQGPEEKRLRKLAKSMEAPVDFLGFMDYETMAAYLSVSDICVNCIKRRASQSVINKAADYFASGKPVINCGPCREMSELISAYECGVNYEAENIESCVSAVETILADPAKAEEYGIHARRLAEEKFDRVKTHQNIIHMIDRLSS